MTFDAGNPRITKCTARPWRFLAGDALLTMAFDLISRPDLMKGCDPGRQVRILQELAFGSGNMGMVGGQVFDIQAEHKDIDLTALQNIHKHKTGMLIRAAVRMGAIAGGANDRQLDDMTGYAEDIGLAFQIADDVLNVTGTREELGKNPNTDAERGKKTYPTFYGVEGAKRLADECVTRADRPSRFLRPFRRSAARTGSIHHRTEELATMSDPGTMIAQIIAQIPGHASRFTLRASSR